MIIIHLFLNRCWKFLWQIVVLYKWIFKNHLTYNLSHSSIMINDVFPIVKEHTIPVLIYFTIKCLCNENLFCLFHNHLHISRTCIIIIISKYVCVCLCGAYIGIKMEHFHLCKNTIKYDEQLSGAKHHSGGVTWSFIPGILTCYKLVLNTCTYTHNINYTIYKKIHVCIRNCANNLWKRGKFHLRVLFTTIYAYTLGLIHMH